MPQLMATAVIVGLIYPLFEGAVWGGRFGFQAWLKGAAGAEFHGFAGSVVVHAVGGWIGLAAVLLLGARANRYLLGKNDPGFAYNGPLAGLVAVCAGSDLMHPIGALVVGGVAGAIFVSLFTLTQNTWKIDDVLGVWLLHRLCGAWGGVACGIFGQTALGGRGGVTLAAQLIGTVAGVAWALLGGLVVYGTIKALLGLRLSPEEEYEGADLSIRA
jgi:Amt family ammonium transporter